MVSRNTLLCSCDPGANLLLRKAVWWYSAFIRVADEPLDQSNRLLAYMSPYYTSRELASMSLRDRATFNLLMVESGWAATFPIYPSLPRYIDLVILQEVAKGAYDSTTGAWADPMMLTGYEYRMCVKLYRITRKLVDSESVSTRDRYGWIERYCVDMCTREIFGPQEYYQVAPYNRIFIWPNDVTEAVGKINLAPAD